MRTILVALSLLALAACGEAEKTTAQYLAQAKAHIAAAEYPAATIELQNALRLDVNSVEARWLLGQAYLETGDIAAAENELQRAQTLGWTADDIRPALARTLLAQGKFDEVLQLDYQDLAPSAAAALLSSQTMAALSARRTEQAGKLVRLALTKDPQLLAAKLAGATIAVHLGDPAVALTLTEAILESAPDNGEAWWLKGQALTRLGKLEEARAALDKSIALADTGPSYRIARALISMELLDYDAARADATKLLIDFPKNPAVNYVQGLLYVKDKNYRKAISALLLAEPAAKEFPLTPYFLGMAYLNEKDATLAAKYAREFVNLAPEDIRGRKLLAAILLLQDQPGEAQKLLQAVLDTNPNDVAALNILANALLLDDQADLGLVLYARMAQLQPEWRVIALRQEVALVTTDSVDKASPFADAAPQATDNYPQTEVLQIMQLLQKKDYPGAIAAAKSYQFRELESVAPYHLLGMIYLAAGQRENARDAFQKALQRKPDDPAANQGLARLALAQNDIPGARQHFQAVLDSRPDDLTTLLLLADLEKRTNNVPAMFDRLNQASAAHPTALEPRLILAGHYLRAAQPEKVEPLFATLTPLQHLSPRVLELIGMAQLARQQNDLALQTLQKLVAAKPESADAHYLLATAATATGDVPKAKQELTEGAKRDPRHVPSLVGLAKIARIEGQQTAFEQYLATLVELAPDNPDVLRLRTLSAQLNGQTNEALVFARQAFTRAPSTQTVLELSALLQAAGRHAGANKTLFDWLQKNPADVAVHLSLANSLERENNLAGAQAQYLAVLEREPGNLTALNNLAWNLRHDQPKKALEYIRSAVTIAPNLPALLDTLAVVESLNGHHAAAQGSIQRALASAPDDPSLRFHEAMITAARGDKAQAITTLEALLAKHPDGFPERAEAQALLRTLKG